MVNPFDLKAALAAKHAQHVVLIHFPIALFIAGVAFDFLAQWTKRQSLAAAAYCNFLVAAVATVPAMITGLLAWQWHRRCFQHVDLCGLADSFEREANAEPGSTDLLPSPGSTDCGAACPYRTPWWIPQRRKRAGLDLRASRLGSFSMETNW